MAAWEDIRALPDAVIQSRLPRAADLILAAVLVGCDGPDADRLWRNLSARRRESVRERLDEARRLPPRAKETARRVVAKVLLGIEDAETRAGAQALDRGEGEFAGEQLRRILERHPVAQEARRARARAAAAELLRRIVHGA